MSLAYNDCRSPKSKANIRQKRDHKEKQRKLILVYTPHPSKLWGPRDAEEANSYKFADWDGTPCEEDRYQITFDTSLPNFSSVLVHVGHSTFNVDEAKSKSPGVMPIGYRADGVYNWTATYRRDSDFFVPYGSYSPLKIPNKSDGEDFAEQPDEDVNYAKGKNKMDTFGVSSHCNERGFRFAFVRALMKHIQISLYGKCATMFESNNTWKCPRHQNTSKEIQRHKFYLAFENSLYVDYITEKYWRNSLERGLVPIVLGGAQYSPEQVIPGSFISAADFDSVKELVDYLKHLDKNDTAYNQYFQWKTNYVQGCQVRVLVTTKPAKIYHKMSEFWGIKGPCKLGEERIWSIINRG